MDTINRPALDRALYDPSPLWAAAYLTYAPALFVVPAWGSYWTASADLPLWAQVPVIAVLTVLSAYGINMMGFVGHEGTHGSLLRNRKLSALVGIFYASAVLTYMELGFALSHWNHHRYTNQQDDPDIAPVAGLKTWWQRLLFSRLIYNTLYFKYTLQMALGKPTPFKYKMAYSHKDQVMFARANFLFSALWIGLYALVFAYDWRAGVFAVLLPTIAVNFVGACQIFIDHAGLDDRLFGNAWSRTSPLMTLLFFGANYHLEHHAYPGIPCYRLPRVHRILERNGTYTALQPPIVRGFLKAFAPLAMPYVTSSRGKDFDAFDKAVSDGKTIPEKQAMSGRAAAAVPGATS